MGGIHATYSEKSTPPAEVHPKSESQLENSTLQHYKDSAEKYCWNQICPKWPTNHGSVTAKGLTGLVDLLYGLERKPYGENRNSDSRVNCAPIALVRGQASNTATEQIRNPARQHQSRDVKVGDNPAAQTLSFGKEIEEHTIQQGSVRVNNGMQQSVGELATQTSPLS
ncbi:hypothetical protein R3P38DRAFT_2800722 [Favolaschia claudopus]|uniref:Prolactin receptor n=1 Tax=Favolaschia claudopus TaxID=2862362 RepID=A0AAV9ZXC4_9AGAR